MFANAGVIMNNPLDREELDFIFDLYGTAESSTEQEVCRPPKERDFRELEESPLTELARYLN